MRRGGKHRARPWLRGPEQVAAETYGQLIAGAFRAEEESMGAAERRKGAAGEREFAGRVQELLGVECARRLGQERDGGADVHVGTVAVQVKRCEAVRLVDWLQQAIDDTPDGMLSALAWRRSRGPWVVAMPLEDWATLVRESLDDDGEEPAGPDDWGEDGC